MIEQIGKHTVSCASLETVDFGALMGGRKANVFFSDPPWGEGNTKYWNTMNKKMTGEDIPRITYNTLINKIVEIRRFNVDGYVFIATGLRFEQELIDLIKPYVYNIRRQECLYNNKTLKYVVISCATRPELFFDVDITKIYAYDIVNTCIKKVSKDGDIVLDPCCGLGYVAKSAVENNLIFIGNELNKKRLEKTKSKLYADKRNNL